MKRALSLFLSIVLVLGIFISVPFTESPFKITAEAASVSDLTFELNDDGESYYVSDCNSSASGALEIPSTYNGKTVTSIGENAFNGCSSLTSITIPDSVTSIGEGAFYACESLMAINVSSRNRYYTSVDGVLFNKAKKDLIQYPAGKTSTSYTIPDSVTSIDNEAFSSCTSLTSITIPNSVTSIGGNAFYHTAYYNDSSNWENGVLYIGNHLIEAKTSISGSYEIKAGTKTIADDAFWYCTRLTSITIPDSVTSIGVGAFYYCTSVTEINVSSSNQYYTSVDGVLFNKAKTELIQYPARKTNASYAIPNSVTSIGYGAFVDCDSLTSITIPDSVTSIGFGAFYYCTSLTAINVSSSNLYYTSVDGVLFNKAKTELIQYPAGKTDTSYTIPDGVTSIGYSAFEDCFSLTSITIGNSVTSIGDSAFSFCDSLTSITIPNSVTSIGGSAFYGCGSLTSITISDSVTSIGVWTFRDCYSLTSITIPDSVTSIGWGAFLCCYSLSDAYYFSSSEDWSNISIGSLNDPLLDATIHYNSVSCSHTSTKWITDEAATVNAAGSQHKECTVCGEVLETAVIPQLKPSTPTLSKATNANGGVTVTWKAVSGADSYRVYRKTSSSGWTCLNSKVTSTSYIDKTAKTGTTYYYTVRAENEAGLSGYNSTGVSVKYLAMPTVTIANASTGVKVSWNKISGASKYYVYRKASGEKSWTRLTDSATGTSYTDTKAKSGTTYYYTVKAVSGSTSSEYKSSAALKYLAMPKVSSLSNENSGITVKWNKITGASGYYVYRKTGSGSWSLIYTVKSGSTVSYTDKSAKAGTTYYYTVRAYSGSVKSTYTSSSAIRRLTTPTLKSVSSAKSGITFKWNKVTGASGYYVYRKTGSGGWKKIDTVKSGSTVSYLDKTAKKGTTYTYTVRAYYSSSISYFNTTGLKIKDKY